MVGEGADGLDVFAHHDGLPVVRVVVSPPDVYGILRRDFHTF